MIDLFLIGFLLISGAVGLWRKATPEFWRLIGAVICAKGADMARGFVSPILSDSLSYGFIYGQIYSLFLLFFVFYALFCGAVMLGGIATSGSQYKTAKELAQETEKKGEGASRFMGLVFGLAKGLVIFLVLFHWYLYMPRLGADQEKIKSSKSMKLYEKSQELLIQVPGDIPILRNISGLLTTPGAFSALDKDPSFIDLARSNENIKKIMDNRRHLMDLLNSKRFDLLSKEQAVKDAFSDQSLIEFFSQLDISVLK